MWTDNEKDAPPVKYIPAASGVDLVPFEDDDDDGSQKGVVGWLKSTFNSIF
ncbi:MAG TPA: hypothetical protein HA262_11410 [Methanosarcina sp.]|nr:hypothetical protein [Methanosarcina sp.]